MTAEELRTVRELIYALQDILHCMIVHPEKTARDIAGDIADPDDPIACLAGAFNRAGAMFCPAWADATPRACPGETPESVRVTFLDDAP